MQNILQEVPREAQVGRFGASLRFVPETDIKGKEILDIGCGYGWCELSFLSRGARGITGMEIEERDLETIRKNIQDDRLKLAVGSATALPFPDASFDTVVSWEVIEHIPKGTEKQMFQEIARVLRPGGAFYLSTPYASLPAMLLDPAWWLAGHRHYSQFLLERYARQAGLEVGKIQVLGGWWNIFSILNMYASKWLLRRWMLAAEYFVERENREYEEGRKGFTNIFAQYRKKV